MTTVDLSSSDIETECSEFLLQLFQTDREADIRLTAYTIKTENWFFPYQSLFIDPDSDTTVDSFKPRYVWTHNVLQNLFWF